MTESIRQALNTLTRMEAEGAENEEDAEFARINDPRSFNVIDTFSENDQVEVQK